MTFFSILELMYVGCNHDQQTGVLMSQDEVTEFLNVYHSTPVGGHSGFNTTLGKLSQRYTWSGMKEEDVEYVSKSWSVAFYIT